VLKVRPKHRYQEPWRCRRAKEEQKKVVAKMEREESMVRKSGQPDIVGLAGSPYLGPRTPGAWSMYLYGGSSGAAAQVRRRLYSWRRSKSGTRWGVVKMGV